jgi:hypothetical protein
MTHVTETIVTSVRPEKIRPLVDDVWSVVASSTVAPMPEVIRPLVRDETAGNREPETPARSPRVFGGISWKDAPTVTTSSTTEKPNFFTSGWYIELNNGDILIVSGSSVLSCLVGMVIMAVYISCKASKLMNFLFLFLGLHGTYPFFRRADVL